MLDGITMLDIGSDQFFSIVDHVSVPERTYGVYSSQLHHKINNSGAFRSNDTADELNKGEREIN